MRGLLRYAVLAVVLMAALALFHWGAEWIGIDRCLDQGGRWNDGAGACEGARAE